VTAQMRRNRSRLGLAWLLAVVLVAAALPGVAEAKRAKRGGTVDITKIVGAPIPDGGILSSTIDVAGRKLRGTVVRDVNAAVQITGLTPIAIGDLAATLTAPNGATTFLFFTGLGPGQQIGPLTLDDETPVLLSFGTPDDPTSLYAPYQGTAQPDGFPLAIMDSGRASGTWKLTVTDFLAEDASVLNSWRLNLIAGRPYKTK
jgi:hypothetical protein